MEKIQESLLDYFNCDQQEEYDKFFNFLGLLNELEVVENKHYFKSLLHLIAHITDNHSRTESLNNKIENIFENLRENIISNFSNFNIFNIFKNNKMILLILFKNKILTPDESISSFISKYKYRKMFYPHYFIKEFKTILKYEIIKEIQISNPELFEMEDEIFENKRKSGTNDNEICQIIYKDSIDDFIVYVNEKNISLAMIIKPSIFETNLYLLKNKNQTLLEYATFFGSVRIIQYLQMNKIELTGPLWIYSIHSGNAELIEMLEDNQIEPLDYSNKEIYDESIKCHQKDITYHIIDNYIIDENKSDNNLKNALHYFNFIEIINTEIFNDPKQIAKMFLYFCEYDYYFFVDLLINNYKINTSIGLFKAVEKGNYEIVELLISKNKNFNRLIQNDKSLFHLAVEIGNIELVKLLLDSRNINSTSKYNNVKKTALYIAAEKGYLDIFKILLNHQEIDINKEINVDSEMINMKSNALQIAFQKQYFNFAKLLLERKNIDVCKELTYQDQSLNEYNKQKIIHVACNQCCPQELFQYLLSIYKDDINEPIIDHIGEKEKIRTVLHILVEKGYYDLCKILLLQTDIDINAKYIYHEGKDIHLIGYNNGFEKTALHIAIENDFENIVELLLLRDDIDVNANYVFYKSHKNEHYLKKTALHIAIEKGNLFIINQLLSRKDIDVNAKCVDDYYQLYTQKTALHIAVEKGNFEIIKLLLDRPDIDVNAIYYKKGEKTALQIAVEKNRIDIIELLLSQQKLDVNMKSFNYIYRNYEFDKIEKTALTTAVENKSLEMVSLLLERKDIDVNSRSILYKGNNFCNKCEIVKDETSLHICVEKNFIDIIDLLLEHENIDVNALSINKEITDGKTIRKDRTPLYISIQNKNNQIAELLINHLNIDVNAVTLDYNENIYNKLKEKTEQPLFHAALNSNNLFICNLLLSHQDIDLNAKTIFYTKDIFEIENNYCIKDELTTDDILLANNLEINFINENEEEIIDENEEEFIDENEEEIIDENEEEFIDENENNNFIMNEEEFINCNKENDDEYNYDKENKNNESEISIENLKNDKYTLEIVNKEKIIQKIRFNRHIFLLILIILLFFLFI